MGMLTAAHVGILCRLAKASDGRANATGAEAAIIAKTVESFMIAGGLL
jgi:hypothetical protein